jgi:hypothetical protein
MGLVALVLLVSLVVFCFRQGFRVQPDKNRRMEDWPSITLGGGNEGSN